MKNLKSHCWRTYKKPWNRALFMLSAQLESTKTKISPGILFGLKNLNHLKFFLLGLLGNPRHGGTQRTKTGMFCALSFFDLAYINVFEPSWAGSSRIFDKFCEQFFFVSKVSQKHWHFCRSPHIFFESNPCTRAWKCTNFVTFAGTNLLGDLAEIPCRRFFPITNETRKWAESQISGNETKLLCWSGCFWVSRKIKRSHGRHAS